MAEENRSMQGKTCMVTGATRGLGQATALELARRGARVIIVGRSPERMEKTLALLHAEGGRDGHCALQADLSSMAEVRSAAWKFLDMQEPLDVLVNNVGVTLLKYQPSPDGYEMTWALNYLGHFLLTHLLMDALQSAARRNGESRVVEITSSMLRFADPSSLGPQRAAGFNGVMAYAQSKRAISLFAGGLAQRLNGCGVMINAVTPGAVSTGIADTHRGLFSRMGMWVVKRFSVPLEQGVQPILHLATAQELCGASGGYYQKYTRKAEGAALGSAEDVERLWKISREMTGLN